MDKSRPTLSHRAVWSSNGFAAAHLDAKQCLLFLAGGDVEPHDELSGADLGRSLASRKIGFELLYGGERTAFSSLRAGEAFVNLVTSPAYEPRWWGRVIFRVDDVDAHYRMLQAQGLAVESPRDAPWGERFFHVVDPDGHELSFAELLPAQS